jgi:hypothetical protein
MAAMPPSRSFSSLLVALVTVVQLAACGPKAKPTSAQPTGPIAVPIPDGPGCPAAASVVVAVWRDATAGVAAGWTLPLANRTTTATSPGFQLLDEAGAASLPPRPARLWLMPPGAPPCEATPGAAYADTVVDGLANDILGVQLTTRCPAPGKDRSQQLIALVADAAPTGCVAILPRPVAGRVGEAQGSSWQILPQSTPMPPAVAAAIPRKECAASCEQLWTVAQLDFGGKPIAWDVSVEWLRVDPAQPDVCQWTTEHDGGIYVANPSGAAETLPHEHAVEPLHLGVLLADRSGPRVLVLEHIGEYATFDLGAGGAAPAPAHHLRWYVLNEELYAGDRKLGPYCGP